MTGKAKEPSVGMVRLDQVVAHPHNVRRDLGDLRSLTSSIIRYGVMVPIIVERYGQQLRLRAGHRRVTAARLAGVYRVPAIIHHEALDEEEWLIASVQENYQRRDLDANERRRCVTRLRDLGLTWRGIAEAFGVTEATARSWTASEEAADQDLPAQGRQSRTHNPLRISNSKVHNLAVQRLAKAHADELDRLKVEVRAELEAELQQKRDELRTPSDADSTQIVTAS